MTEEDIELVKVLFARGQNDTEIGRVIGFSGNAVRDRRYRMSLFNEKERERLEAERKAKKAADEAKTAVAAAAAAPVVSVDLAPIVECLNNIDMRLSGIEDALLAIATQPDEVPAGAVVSIPAHTPEREIGISWDMPTDDEAADESECDHGAVDTVRNEYKKVSGSLGLGMSVRGFGKVADFRMDSGRWVLIDFGNGKYGYTDPKRYLHYLPYVYESRKKAGEALREYVKTGKARDNWFVRDGQKKEDLPIVGGEE